MYAVIETGGTQFRVEEGVQVKVPLMDGSAGDKVSIDKVLLISGDKESQIGKPYLDNANVEAELIGHGKDDKVIVYKFKRRTKYRRSNGHRQQFTELKITKINAPA
ncbi:MAG: 50S ribosomal protein L21 [candidate division Zixibacteria bacterium]|nr:50S ribosomal protein L21 [candidate division Zixibacteria bacterium]